MSWFEHAQSNCKIRAQAAINRTERTPSWDYTGPAGHYQHWSRVSEHVITGDYIPRNKSTFVSMDTSRVFKAKKAWQVQSIWCCILWYSWNCASQIHNRRTYSNRRALSASSQLQGDAVQCWRPALWMAKN